MNKQNFTAHDHQMCAAGVIRTAKHAVTDVTKLLKTAVDASDFEHYRKHCTEINIAEENAMKALETLEALTLKDFSRPATAAASEE